MFITHQAGYLMFSVSEVLLSSIDEYYMIKMLQKSSHRESFYNVNLMDDLNIEHAFFGSINHL